MKVINIYFLQLISISAVASAVVSTVASAVAQVFIIISAIIDQKLLNIERALKG